MDSVEIQLTPESEVQKLDFITWKNDLRSFYAKPSNGKHRVISLIAALPENPKWKGNPFPECVPTKITPCTLLPPRILERWEYDQIPMEEDVLFLTPEDDEPLSALLEESREEANRELIETKNALEKIKNEEEQLLETKNALEIKKITTKRILTERELATNDLKIDNLSKTTLEKIKEGDLGIRNDYLIERWAKRQKNDLDELSQQRVELLDWLEKLDLLDAPQDQDDSIRGDINFQKHLARRKPFPAHRHFDQPMKHKWPDGLSDEVWWVLAKVTHKIEFEDEKTFYLFGVDIRENLRPSEIAELSSIPDGPLNPDAAGKLARANSLLKEKIMIPDQSSDLSPDELKFFNLLIEPHPYKKGMAIPYKDIAKHYGVSHTTIRRWRKKLECKHDWVVNVIAGYRKGNSKKPHPKVLKKTIEKSMNPPIKD